MKQEEEKQGVNIKEYMRKLKEKGEIEDKRVESMGKKMMH
jgi:hypothetical protein